MIFNSSTVGVFPFYTQEVSEGEDVTYQLRVTLFDKNHLHFFGKTWKSQPQRMKNSKISFNEVDLIQHSFSWNKKSRSCDFLCVLNSSCCFDEQRVDDYIAKSMPIQA